MLRLPATLMRGGTSKCWVFDAADLAMAEDRLDEVLAAAFGSLDARQIDGVGGATSTTSKAVIVRTASEAEVDVDYLFAQVGIGTATVEWGSNCGNCATAVGLYALQRGLVAPGRTQSTVRLRNRNTGTRLIATIPTPGGVVPELGTATVPGSRAKGVPVALGFCDVAGASTGALLPSGSSVDRIDNIDVTLVDAGAPAALADAAAFSATGLESVEEFAALVPALADLRQAATVRMGLAAPGDPPTYAVPKVGVVGPSADYVTSLGDTISGVDYDLSVRMVSMHAPHPTIGLTSAVAVATAALTPGTLPAKLAESRPSPGVVRIGTPAGVVDAEVVRDATGAVRVVTLHRAARKIATAELSIPVLLQKNG